MYLIVELFRKYFVLQFAMKLPSTIELIRCFWKQFKFDFTSYNNAYNLVL